MSRVAAALLLTGALFPAQALAAEAAEQAPPANPNEPEILVIGTRYISGIQPERDLDEEAISSYDASTVDGLLAEVQSELGEDNEPPLILVNGERVTSLDDIGSLPVEAVTNVKVLPHGSAVGAGGTSTQRVVSLTLKKKVRSATLLAAHKVATDGDWNAERGEAILTYVEGAKRMNVAFRVRDESALFENERGIIQPGQTTAFAQGGNVVGFPLDPMAEIDPFLSALAGQAVTVAAIPALANPTLADFAASANDPAFTDLGQFRTLRPDSRTYDLTGTFATRLAPWLTGNASLRFSHSNRRSARGLPSALFVLPDTNSNSPFSTDVGLALYGPDALHTRSQRDSGEGTLTLNGTFGRWTSHFNARHLEAKDETLTQRAGSFSNLIADSVDPFDGALFNLVPIRTDKATGRTTTTAALLSFSGPAAKLPAGDLQATVEGRFLDNRLRSTTDFSGISQKRSFHRSEWGIRGAVEVPLASAANGFLPGIGELAVTAEATFTDYSDAGTLDQHALGLTWEPRPTLRFRADYEKDESAPAISTLGNPVVVTSGVRVFDPLTGETVDVTQITGGNPDLDQEKTRVWRISGLWTVVPRHNLQLNAEYTDTDERNFVSSVPEASAAVMLAFPDRFVRDLDGTLTTVDLRPINFDSHREKRFRYGLSLNTTIAGGGPTTVRAAPASSDEEETAAEPPAATTVVRAGRPLRLQLSANHSIVFEDKIFIRPGLGSVDLLEGGAIGIAGGRVRHQLDGTAALTSGGLGARLNVYWRGKSTLDSRIGGVSDTLRFSPVLAVNFRAFADMRRFLPDQAWARGMRMSLSVLNATNDRQEVRDSFGGTPLQYQPGYRDPLGRTVELELRKVF